MSISRAIGYPLLALISSSTLSATTTMAVEIKRVSIDGYVSYVEQGQGEPVIFVHGGLQDYRMWSEQLPKFAAHYRAIACNRRSNYPNVVSPE